MFFILFVIAFVLNIALSITHSAMAATGEMGVVHNFSISPDEQKILFISEAKTTETSPNKASIMLFDSMTMDVIGLTGEVKEVALSPDGKYIAYIENDAHYGNSLLLVTVDGRDLKLYFHEPPQRFSQLRWSRDSKYLTFFSDKIGSARRTAVISPQLRVVPEELATVKWLRSKELPIDHPLYQKKPIVHADSSILWGDDKTIYVQAVDGIWKGNLDAPFIVQWTQLVAAEDIEDPHSLSISTMSTHLLYKRGRDFWVLSLEDESEPVKIGEGTKAQFSSDGQWVLLAGIPVYEPLTAAPSSGLWVVSLDGSSQRRLTDRPVNLPQ